MVCRIEIVCRWSSDVNPPVYNPHHSDFNPTHTPAETETSGFGISASRKERWAVVLLTVEVVEVVEIVEVAQVVEIHSRSSSRSTQ